MFTLVMDHVCTSDGKVSYLACPTSQENVGFEVLYSEPNLKDFFKHININIKQRIQFMDIAKLKFSKITITSTVFETNSLAIEMRSSESVSCL